MTVCFLGRRSITTLQILAHMTDKFVDENNYGSGGVPPFTDSRKKKSLKNIKISSSGFRIRSVNIWARMIFSKKICRKSNMVQKMIMLGRRWECWRMEMKEIPGSRKPLIAVGEFHTRRRRRGDIWGVESLNEHMIFNQREVVNCITFEPIRGGHWPAGVLLSVVIN